jgi:hypothetical protein
LSGGSAAGSHFGLLLQSKSSCRLSVCCYFEKVTETRKRKIEEKHRGATGHSTQNAHTIVVLWTVKPFPTEHRDPAEPTPICSGILNLAKPKPKPHENRGRRGWCSFQRPEFLLTHHTPPARRLNSPKSISRRVHADPRSTTARRRRPCPVTDDDVRLLPLPTRRP